MGLLFNRYKPLRNYKLLEIINEKRTELDFSEKNKKNYRILYENEDVAYLVYSGSLLRREKHNKGKLVYLGTAIEPSCYTNGVIIWAFPHAIPMHDHTMTVVDGITGEEHDIDFLGKDEVLGIDTKKCNDKIIDISVSDGTIKICVRRNKSNDPSLEENPFNEDLIYFISVSFLNGVFTISSVTSDSILTRGPWPKPKIQLPPGPYTPAELDVYCDTYGKEAVEEALLIAEIYG